MYRAYGLGLEELSGFVWTGFPHCVEDMKGHFLVSFFFFWFYCCNSLVKIQAIWRYLYCPCNRSDVGHDDREVVRASSFPVNES